ncbi:molybdopterin molybdotransferase MoeA [Kineosporia sp. R_H_3]|uniref:molybdopterin molybdotransferase MoeA n=1 Tax=Kineosporia sp. R_H_3 TaxID=1961848 RepID=UPI0018E9FD53|nr:molybdopterin molybdotransferase MoeA [Kineosporia sp. R_H_3]
MTPSPHDWAGARATAGTACAPVAPRRTGLDHAAGAVLATDALALTDLPATDTSAMDGWAVAGPAPWRLVGAVLAGEVPGPLADGTAVTIATGAVMPPRADGVLRRERGHVAPLADGAARVVPAPGVEAGAALARDVRRAGGECRAGDVVLPAGTLLGPAAVGLLAAAGHDHVEVRRAGVDVLVLGDELLGSGPARDGRLRDALGPLLTAWLPALGLAVTSRRHVPDTAAALDLALRSCTGDVVVTTGSTARGPVDHLHAVLAAAGARLVVDGVAVRPGHPMLLAVLPDGRPLVGLPGNPLAAVSGLLTLLDPVVAALHARPAPPRSVVRLAERVEAGAEATRLVPLHAGRPALFAGPGMLRGLATADVVAVVPPGGAGAGDEVEALTLPGSR